MHIILSESMTELCSVIGFESLYLFKIDMNVFKAGYIYCDGIVRYASGIFRI